MSTTIAEVPDQVLANDSVCDQKLLDKARYHVTKIMEKQKVDYPELLRLETEVPVLVKTLREKRKALRLARLREERRQCSLKRYNEIIDIWEGNK